MNDPSEFTFRTCPSCHSQDTSRIQRSWWMKLIPIKGLRHYRCDDCRTTFMSTKRRSSSGSTQFNIPSTH